MSNEIKTDIMNDPFLKNLFTNDTKHDFNSDRSVNWIKIPTSFLSENGKDSSISMMSVYTYNGEESSEIYKSIKDSREIVFTNDGHVAVSFQGKTQAQFFYPNPTITQNTGGLSGGKPIGIENTVHQQTINVDNSFFFDEKMLFSQNLRWILYQLPGSYYERSESKIYLGGEENLIPITATTWKFTKNRTGKNAVPVYVLLYNPIHRKNFQDIYGKIMDLPAATRNPPDPFSTVPTSGPNTNYVTTIKKYCNAFRVKSLVSPNTGRDLYHYADPGCVIAFDTQHAKLCQSLNLNLTHNSLKNDFYRGGVKGFEDAKVGLSSIPASAAYCRGAGGGPSDFLRNNAKVIRAQGATTDSFLQILSNYQIASSGEDAGASFPIGFNPQLPGETTAGATCPPRNIRITDCSVRIIGGTEVELNKTNITAMCGNDSPPSPISKKPYPVPAKKQDKPDPAKKQDKPDPAKKQDKPVSAKKQDKPVSAPRRRISPYKPAPDKPVLSKKLSNTNRDYLKVFLIVLILILLGVFLIFKKK